MWTSDPAPTSTKQALLVLLPILGQTFDQYWLQLRVLYVTLLPAPAAESDGHLMRRER